MWDRLNRGLKLDIGQRDIVIRAPGYLRPGDNIFPRLAQPFAQPRPYRRWLRGKAALRSKPPGTPESPGIMA